MGNRKFKLFALMLALFVFTVTSFGQTAPKKATETVKKPMKMEKTSAEKSKMEHNKMEKSKMKKSKMERNKVPQAVSEKFVSEYPLIVEEEWYGYPNYNFNDEWYDYDGDLYEYDNPEYYVVEFTKDNDKHHVIYSKEGRKIAVHKRINDLPEAVTQAIKKGPYSKWTISKEKEKIFKDLEMDKGHVYKVEVEMGNQKHHLIYTAQGELLKDKKIR